MSGAIANGGILGAGSLNSRGVCIYCMYRFVNALRTRNIEHIDLDDVDLESARANVLVLQTIISD